MALVSLLSSPLKTKTLCSSIHSRIHRNRILDGEQKGQIFDFSVCTQSRGKWQGPKLKSKEGRKKERKRGAFGERSVTYGTCDWFSHEFINTFDSRTRTEHWRVCEQKAYISCLKTQRGQYRVCSKLIVFTVVKSLLLFFCRQNDVSRRQLSQQFTTNSRHSYYK